LELVIWAKNIVRPRYLDSSNGSTGWPWGCSVDFYFEW
jgi:hypothetical protein